MEVKIKDREEEVEHLRMACNMAELGISYQQADLILRLQSKLARYKGNFSISDGVEILYKWGEDWRRYFELDQVVDNHVCRYSEAMNQLYPRLCIDCGKPERSKPQIDY